MVNLEKMFKDLLNGVASGDTRYRIEDSEHIIDIELGIHYHLYPEWRKKPFKITLNNEEVINGMQMTGREAEILSKLQDHLYRHDTEKNRKILYEMSVGELTKDDLQVTDKLMK